MGLSRSSSSVLLACALAGIACDGTAPSPVRDASPGPADVFDGAAPDAADAPVSDDSTGAPPPDAPIPTPDAPHDTRFSTDAQRDLISNPLPAEVAPPRRIVAGPAIFVGSGADACTNQVPPSANGDRWCAFKRPTADGSATELWVINVTKAIAGAPPPCDGSSADCLRLTSTLWTAEPFGGPTISEAHRFDGDTLLFHAGALSPPDRAYVGPVWAWRPGWPEARSLSARAYICYGGIKAAVAACVDNVSYDASTPVEFDLRAGPLVTPPADVLPKVDHAWLYRMDGELGFGADFIASGELLVYSTPAALRAKTATLRVSKLEGRTFGAPRDILPDATGWQLSPGGTKVFYLTAYDPGVQRGQLMAADLETGANPRRLSTRTGRFALLKGSGADPNVGFFVEPGGRFLSEFNVVHDLSAPAAVVAFRFVPPLEDFHPSSDGRFTGYAKFDRDEGFNGYLARNDGSGDCILSSETDRPAFENAFLAHSGLVFWAERSYDDNDKQDGWMAEPDGCRNKRYFGHHIAFYAPVGDVGLIYADEIDAEQTVSVKYALIANGREWPTEGPVEIRKRVDLPLTILGPDSRHVVFRVSHGSDDEVGLYVVGPLPFGSE